MNQPSKVIFFVLILFTCSIFADDIQLWSKATALKSCHDQIDVELTEGFRFEDNMSSFYYQYTEFKFFLSSPSHKWGVGFH